jgi:steroid delta-isomerase-like uncharacterized protein
MASATTTKESKVIVRQFAEQFVNGGNYETAEEFLADDVADHTPMGETTGIDAVLETTKELRTAFPDFVVTPEQIVAEGDTVAVRMTQRGTHEGVFMGTEPTGNSFEIDAMAFLRLEDGKIVERRVSPDMLGMIQQLGLKDLPTTAS